MTAKLKTAEVPLLKRQMCDLRQFIKDQIKELDGAILARIRSDSSLGAKLKILTSIPGIAEITAFTLLIDMPELGTMNPKQVASLAGVAPFTKQSGKVSGKQRIRGGRAALRRAIYMPALVAVRVNPDMKRTYEKLLSVGKPPKVALIAIVRKLLILANSLLKDGRTWVHKTA